jgi:predicted membrane chloride channel (bestrophin family)
MKTQSPEEKILSIQIAECSAKIDALKKHLKTKTKEIDKKILQDNANLFGERASEPQEVNLLFSERVDTSQRNKVLNPIKALLYAAENELKNLQNKKETMPKTGILF